MPGIYAPLQIFDPVQRIEFKPDRAQHLVDQAHQKRVLHVGCTDAPLTQERISSGALLHLKLRQVAESIVGIDIATDELQMLRNYGCDDVIYMDAEKLSFVEKFDCILAGDVLEHLNNPGLFVAGARNLLSPGGVLVIGVPSALSGATIKTWLLNREDVHREHTFYFSPKTLSELCRRHGLLPTRLVFTAQAPSPWDSPWYIRARGIAARLRPSLSPSIIMHFKVAEDVDQSSYVVWK